VIARKKGKTRGARKADKPSSLKEGKNACRVQVEELIKSPNQEADRLEARSTDLVSP